MSQQQAQNVMRRYVGNCYGRLGYSGSPPRAKNLEIPVAAVWLRMIPCGGMFGTCKTAFVMSIEEFSTGGETANMITTNTNDGIGNWSLLGMVHVAKLRCSVYLHLDTSQQ
jgi:hypothetical protein